MNIVCKGRWLLLGLSALGLVACTATEPRPEAENASATYATTERVSPADALATRDAASDADAAEALVQQVLVQQQAAAPSSSADEYVLGPHDLLEISVFQVDELSRTVRVNSRGTFSLPLIGVIQAAGQTSAQIEDDIAKKLYDCCMQDPQVSIFITEFVSQRVTVEGEVQKPGVYPLTGRTTLLQAVAMAAGSGELADLSEVRVFRDLTDGTKEQLVFDISQIRQGKLADPLLQGNDIVVVGKSGSLTFIKGVTDTLRGFVGFGTVR